MQLNFNAATVDPSSSFDPIPSGWYVAEIIESEEKDTKSGNGSYLQLTFKVIEGEYSERQIWARLNLNNPNSTAVEIAQKDLSAICHAVNEMNLTDSAQLHGKPMRIKVSVRPASGDYDASNEIKGYEPLNGSKPTMAVNNTAGDKKSGNDRPW